jgi:hypothetical protein
MQILEETFMGPASKTCHLFITELTFRDSSEVNGSRQLHVKSDSLHHKETFFFFFWTLEIFKLSSVSPISYLFSYKYQGLNG